MHRPETMERFPSIYSTIALMQDLHRGQVDKSGAPYWTHPLRVMLRLGPNAHPVERHATLLHDTVEDCGITPVYLAKRGYGPRVIHCVNLLTHEQGRTRRGYIDRLLQSGNEWAIRAKLADLYDNSAPGRRAGVEPEVVQRYEALVEQFEAVMRKEYPRLPLPFKGDPVSHHLMWHFWPPHVYAISNVPTFHMQLQLEKAIEQQAFG